MRRLRIWALASAVGLAVSFAADFDQAALAQIKRSAEPVNKERMNNNTVGIASGKSGSAALAAAEDLTAVLDDGDELRILAVVGKGSLQNVRDALFLRNMDMGITQSDVLARFKKTGELGAGIESRLVYITRLYNEELHVLAGPDIADLRDLEGKAVNFGEVGSGTELTGRQVFEALKINVRPVHMPEADGLLKIRSGEIAASVLLAGKPSTAYDRIRTAGELKLISIPYEEALEQDYLPAKLTHADYPNLIAEGESVDTIAVSAVLAAYNWPSGTDRHRRVAKFAQAFFSKFEELRKEPRHPKWREVNLLADVPGWQRFGPARAWLEANAPARPTVPAAGSVAAQRRTFEQFLQTQRRQGAAGLPAGSAAEQAFFEKFVEWMKQNNPGALAGGAAGAGSGASAVPDPRPSGQPPPSGQRLW